MATNNITALAAKNHPTKALIESGKSLVLTCGVNKGLRLSANQDGSKTWTYRYRNMAGKLKQIKLGTYSDTFKLTEAKKLYDKYKWQRDEGSDPAQDLVDKREQLKAEALEKATSGYTVEQLMSDYLVEHIEKERVASGITKVTWLINKHINPKVGKRPVLELTRREVRELSREIESSSVADSVVLELAGAYSHAEDEERIPEDYSYPTEKVKRRHKSKPKLALSLADVSTLIKKLPSMPINEDIKRILLLCLFTGCRSGEIVSISWSDINFKESVLTLTETKTNIPRRVQLTEQAMQIIEAGVNNGSKWLFPSEVSKSHLLQATVVAALCRGKEQANKFYIGIGDWSAHDLRRTVRTELSTLACPQAVADAVLGHSKQGVQGVYDLSSREPECRVWLQRWCDKIYPLHRDDKVVKGVFK